MSHPLLLLFLYLKENLIHNLHYASGVDRDRVFFVDIMARSFLLQTCLAQLKLEYPAEKLPVLQPQPIDKWPLSTMMGHIDDQNEDTFGNWGELESRFEKKE